MADRPLGLITWISAQQDAMLASMSGGQAVPPLRRRRSRADFFEPHPRRPISLPTPPSAEEIAELVAEKLRPHFALAQATSPSVQSAPAEVVVLGASELAKRITDALASVTSSPASAQTASAPTTKLLDRVELAQTLDISVASLDRARNRAFPSSGSAMRRGSMSRR